MAAAALFASLAAASARSLSPVPRSAVMSSLGRTQAARQETASGTSTAASSMSRRAACATLGFLAAAYATPVPAQAAASRVTLSDADPLVALYFGAGCFWHVQHELVLHEAAALGRRGAEVTAVSGYAGGTKLGDSGRVCYHNPQGVADYGKLGHAEVVQVKVPASMVASFSSKYFSIFGDRGYRHDPQDRGGEYRSVMGLPGGTQSALYATVAAAAKESPMRLVEGRGDEEDTLADRTVLIMDSNKFPFYPAELYHQFHNDFQGPPYGSAYNNLLKTLYKAGELKPTGCPDMV